MLNRCTISPYNWFLLFSFLGLQLHGVSVSAEDGIISTGAIPNVDSRIRKEEKLSVERDGSMFNAKSSTTNELVLHSSDSGGDPFQASITAGKDSNIIIGAIINVNSRMGKEEKIAMEIAIQELNDELTKNQKLVLQVMDSGGKPLKASKAAEKFASGRQVQTIVGMETWREATWVTEIANQAQVPVLPLVAPSITPALASMRWPYLVRMSKDDSLQIQCLASIVKSYEWRRVIAIYEDDGSQIRSTLSDALHAVGSEIEHWLAFPPLTSLFDPERFIRKELETLNAKQSRVFVILRSSLELATYVFPEAKRMGLMGKDSVWITTDSLADILHAVNSTVISSMQGVIGIQTYFNHTNPSFKKFSLAFGNLFRSRYPEEEKSEPGFYAVRAYDTISTVAFAAGESRRKSNRTNTRSPRSLLENILASKFNGLSGEIQFEDREVSRLSIYEIINVVGESFTTLKFWASRSEFSADESGQEDNKSGGGGSGTEDVLGSVVLWPGGLQRDPLGWVMPTDENPLIIGVPGKTPFEKFVKVEDGKEPTGFCIEVFKSALGRLNYSLPYKFHTFNGTYDELLDQVHNKIYGAVVGDITILRRRSERVDFTQPYAESALTMVVPVASQLNPLLIVKPFHMKLWLVVISVFLYTAFTVWFFETGSNEEFRGSWRDQIGSAMWFTCTTLFFAHRESFRSNYTRIVMFFWLVTVFIVTSSYIASLTSMLTVKSLRPVTDIEMLRRDNSPIGCDTAPYIRKYLEDVLHFPPHKIVNITSQYDYPGAFENGSIKAAFLELPYARVLLSRNSTHYIEAGLRKRLGGLAFVFPKGSPVARDFSRAILEITEDGTLNTIDQGWFESYSFPDDSISKQRLSLDSFWPLFVILTLSSTLLLIIYTIRKNSSKINQSFWNWMNMQSHESPSIDELRTLNIPSPPTTPEIEIGVVSTPQLERSASASAGRNRPGQHLNHQGHGWDCVYAT